MKKFLVLILLSVSTLSSPAQTIQQALQPTYEYCEIVGVGKYLSTKVSINIDYGQKARPFSKDRRIRDRNGDIIEFNSIVDALNFLSADGWDFLQAYVLPDQEINTTVYVMRRPLQKTQDEQDIYDLMEDKSRR